MTSEEIGALAAYFTGPTVAENSIRLEAAPEGSTARSKAEAYFALRKRLGIHNYPTLTDGIKLVRAKVEEAKVLAEACKLAGVIPTQPAVTRGIELLKLVSAFVEQNGYESGALTYDEADCDGQCFATDCMTAAEELERQFGVSS